MKTRSTALILILLGFILVLLACNAQDDPAVRAIVRLDPTATTQITPAPLLLTPIATPQPLPEIPPLPGPGQSSKSIAAHDDLLVTVNSDSDSITVLRGGAVVDEIAVGDDPRTVAITPDGRQAVEFARRPWHRTG